MALTPANQDAFFREVDDELRRAQLQTAWQRWGKVAVAGVVLALVLLAAGLYWQHRRNEARADRAATLTTAIADLGDAKEAPAKAALAKLAASDDRAYAIAARMTEAGLAQAKGDIKAATAGFAAIAADEDAPQPFRDLATIRGVAAQFDTLPPQQVIDRLRTLAVPGNPWFGSAGEMTALAQLKLGRRDKAAPLIAAIAADKALPITLRSRVVRFSGQLGVDTVPADLAGQQGR